MTHATDTGTAPAAPSEPAGGLLWHVTAANHRESITALGLVPAEPDPDDDAHGVHVVRAPSAGDAAAWFDVQYGEPGHQYDVWQVAAAGLPVHDDATWRGEAAVIPGGVSPGGVTRAGSFRSAEPQARHELEAGA